MNFIKSMFIRLLSAVPAGLDGTSVLMYHSVSDSEALFAVSVQEFEKQMRYIHDRNLATIYSSEIVLAKSTKDTVCVTFDDGYSDVYTNALPILKKYGIKATVFLITDQLGGTYTNSEGLKIGRASCRERV